MRQRRARAPPVASARREAALGGLAAAGAVALLLLLPIAYAAPLPSTAIPLGSADLAFPSGRVGVDLAAATTSGFGADLSVDQVVELDLSGSGPSVVSAAFPTILSLSAPNGAGHLPVEEAAVLEIYPVDSTPLWNGPEGEAVPAGAPIGHANLTVVVAPASLSGGGSGVELTWTILGWSPRSSLDLLGLEIGVSTDEGTSLLACQSAPATAVAGGCPGTALPPGQSLWGGGVVGLQELAGSNGSVAVDWSPSVGLPSAPNASTSVGILDQSPSEAHLVVAASPGGAASISGSVGVALLAFVPSVPFLFVGEPGWFLGSALLTGSAGIAASWLYRRRERAIAAAL